MGFDKASLDIVDLGKGVLTITDHLSARWKQPKCSNKFGRIYLLHLWSFHSPSYSQGTGPLIILCVPHWPSELHFVELKKNDGEMKRAA